MLSDAEKRARLEKALEYGGGTHGVSDIIDLARDGKIQMWEEGDGLIITEITQYPRKKCVGYWTISGELADCLSLDDRISRWAISEGCERATAVGRIGWARVGAPYGWRLHMHTFYKELVS